MNKKLAEEIRSTINMLLDISGGTSSRKRVLEIRKQANETLKHLKLEEICPSEKTTFASLFTLTAANKEELGKRLHDGWHDDTDTGDEGYAETPAREAFRWQRGATEMFALGAEAAFKAVLSAGNYLTLIKDAVNVARETTYVPSAPLKVRVPVKKFVDDESLSWEERFYHLNQHHLAETGWLIGELERVRNGLDSDEVFNLACKHFAGACGYADPPSDEDETYIEPEELEPCMKAYNDAYQHTLEDPSMEFRNTTEQVLAFAHEKAVRAVIQEYYRFISRHDAHVRGREVRHAMGHVFQDVLKPELLNIPCPACSPEKVKE